MISIEYLLFWYLFYISIYFVMHVRAPFISVEIGLPLWDLEERWAHDILDFTHLHLYIDDKSFGFGDNSLYFGSSFSTFTLI